MREPRKLKADKNDELWFPRLNFFDHFPLHLQRMRKRLHHRVSINVTRDRTPPRMKINLRLRSDDGDFRIWAGVLSQVLAQGLRFKEWIIAVIILAVFLRC